MRLRYPRLFATALILLSLGTGVVAQPFTAQIQQALQILGLWPYGVYGNGTVPTWNSTTNQFAPGGGGAGPSTAMQFISSAGTTCAAPALTSTAAATSGIAITATPSVLTCVGSTAVVTAAAASVTSTVSIRGPDGTTGSPTYTFSSDPDTGILWPSSGITRFIANNVPVAQVDASGITILSNFQLRFGSSTDLVLAQEAPDYLFQRRGANAQRDCLANTYASATNYTAACRDWQTTANTFIFGTRTAATGSGQPMMLVTQTNSGSDDFAAIRMTRLGFPMINLGLSNAAGTFGTQLTSAGTLIQLASMTNTATSGSFVGVAVAPTYNQSSGTAANTDLLVNRTQTAVGSGAQLLMDLQVGSISLFSVTNGGVMTAKRMIGAADATGNAVETLTSVATNDDPTENTVQGRVATTDATVTTINTITIPTSTSTIISCRVTARRTGGSAGAAEDSAMYALYVGVKNTAGTVAEVAAETLAYTAESQATWNLTAAPSGATELIQVTGAANNNVTWHSTCRTMGVNQ